MNYYNEWDSFAADWLEELIKENLIPNGVVDRRSIEDVKADDLKEFTQCHFFAGIGGWSYALQLANWPTDRQVWTGSPPCQPFSSAGKHKGKDDERHLWPVFFHLIAQCQPPTIFGEQVVPSIKHGWFDDLQADLEKENYASGMVVLPACSVGAPHKRDRLFYFAELADTSGSGSQRRVQGRQDSQWEMVNGHFRRCSPVKCKDGKRRPIPVESSLFPLVDGVSNRVGLLRGAGNAIVPQVAAEVIKGYMSHE